MEKQELLQAAAEVCKYCRGGAPIVRSRADQYNHPLSTDRLSRHSPHNTVFGCSAGEFLRANGADQFFEIESHPLEAVRLAAWLNAFEEEWGRGDYRVRYAKAELGRLKLLLELREAKYDPALVSQIRAHLGEIGR